MPFRDRFLHWLWGTCLTRHLLEDWGTDTYTCGVCHAQYSGEKLGNYGLERPKLKL